MTALRQQFERSWRRYLEWAQERERKRATRLPTWRTRKHRSALATLMLLGCLLMIAASISIVGEAMWTFAGLWFGGYLVWLVAYGLLRSLTGRVSCGFMSLLDERERAWRHRATHIGFNVLTTLAILGVLVYQFVLSDMTPHDDVLVLFIGALVILGVSTPTMILGWTLPDDYPEDADELVRLDEPEFSTDPQQNTG